MNDITHAVCACLVGAVLAGLGARAQSPAAAQPTAQEPSHDHVT